MRKRPSSKKAPATALKVAGGAAGPGDVGILQFQSRALKDHRNRRKGTIQRWSGMYGIDHWGPNTRGFDLRKTYPGGPGGVRPVFCIEIRPGWRSKPFFLYMFHLGI